MTFIKFISHYIAIEKHTIHEHNEWVTEETVWN